MSSLRPSRKFVDARLVLVLAAMLVAIGISVAVSVSRSYGQMTGTPGSPSATTTISGEQPPAPPAPFGGTNRAHDTRFDAVLVAAHRPAEGRAECAAHHD